MSKNFYSPNQIVSYLKGAKQLSDLSWDISRNIASTGRKTWNTVKRYGKRTRDYFESKEDMPRSKKRKYTKRKTRRSTKKRKYRSKSSKRRSQYSGKYSKRRQSRVSNYVKKLCGVISEPNIIRGNSSGVVNTLDNESNLNYFTCMDASRMDAFGDDVYRWNYDDVGSALERIAPDLRTSQDAKVKLCTGSFYKITFRNNTSVDCTLKYYVVVNKIQTLLSPTDCVEDGMGYALEGVAYDKDSTLNYPMDSRDFRNTFKVKYKKVVIFRPGDVHSIFVKLPVQVHKFSMYDNNSNNQRFKAPYILFQIRGPIAHDSTNATTEVGYAKCQLDYIQEHKYVIRAMNEHTGYTVQPSVNLDTFTNAANVYDKDNATVESYDV